MTYEKIADLLTNRSTDGHEGSEGLFASNKKVERQIPNSCNHHESLVVPNVDESYHFQSVSKNSFHLHKARIMSATLDLPDHFEVGIGQGAWSITVIRNVR